MDKPQVTVLENGLTVVTQQMDTKQVYANVAVGVGARHESAEEAGISHYLEHMLASDTERMTSEEQDTLVQDMRGYSNASTNYEKTDYYYRVANEYTEDAIQMLSDSIQRATLDPARIEVERKAVQEELRGDQSDPDRIIYEQLLEVAYPDSGLDKSIGGDIPTVEGHMREDLVAFMDKHYTADKMVLTVVGDVDHEQIVGMAKKHFNNLPQIPKDQQVNARPAEYRGGMRTRSSEETEQVSLFMGFEGTGTNDPDTQMVDNLLGSILGGGFASRLMRSLRSEKGLVYGASAGTIGFQDSGVFVIQAGMNGQNAGLAVDAICDEILKFADTVTEKELASSKNSLLGSLERSVESAESVGGALVSNMTVNGRATSVDEKIDRVNNVTLDQIKARAKEIFSSAPCISAHGKGVENIPSYEEITEKLGNKRALGENGLVRPAEPSADRAVSGAQITAQPPAKQHAVGQ